MKLLIAGGGTGGHIYPAIAIAKEFLKQFPEAQVEFVGTPQGLETQILPRENFKLHLISVGKLNYSGGVFKKIITLMSLPIAFLKSVLLLIKLKPNFVLGVGGYVSGPFVLVASLLGFKTLIWEPNAIPGVTNRVLSRFVRASLVVFDEAQDYLKSNKKIKVGLPVRESIEKLENLVPVNRDKESHTSKRTYHVLIFGGSQGARAINQVVQKLLLSDSAWREGIEFRHQTGALDFSVIQKDYQKLNDSNVNGFEYFHDMDNQYQWADLIICRSGASTVAEVSACGKPALFIPLPWAADNHQKKNAESLVKADAALMIEQKDLTEESLRQAILSIKNDFKKQIQMSHKIKAFHTKNAAHRIVKIMTQDL